MTNSPAQGLCTYLLLRVTDVVRLRMRRQSALLATTCALPPCFQFESGHLCGAPEVRSASLSPLRAGSCCLEAQLCLPVCLCLQHECSRCAVTGTLTLPVNAVLRSPCGAPLQFFPQAEVCICDVQLQEGCLCVFFDIALALYAACLAPVQLSAACAQPCACACACPPDCAPYFNLPLYPELPCPR